jgi:hypothetical protein
LPGVDAEALRGDGGFGSIFSVGLPVKNGCIDFVGFGLRPALDFFWTGMGSGIRSSPLRTLSSSLPKDVFLSVSRSLPYRKTTTRVFGGFGSFAFRGRPRLLGSVSPFLPSSFSFVPGELNLPPALSFIIFFGGVPGVGRVVSAAPGSGMVSIVVGGGI